MMARPRTPSRAVLLAALALGVLASPGCGDDGDPVEAMGTLEVIEVDVAPMAPARVVRVWRREGDTVRAGDTLVSLTQATVRPEVEASRARLAAAEAQLRDLVAGARTGEIERAEAELRAAQAEAARTQRDHERLAALAQAGAISRQQLDAAASAAQLAAARQDAVRQALQLLREGTRPERISAARAEVQSARAALAAATQVENELVLVAPIGGVVMSRLAEPGEVLGAGVPALVLGDVRSPFARIYVNALVLPRVQLGAHAVGVLDGLPDREFAGEVVAVNSKAEFTPRVALTEDERADLLFGVKVAFRDSAGRLKPGLPISVRIPSTGIP